MKDKYCAIITEDFAGMKSQAFGIVEYYQSSWEFHPVKVKKYSLGRFLPVSLWAHPSDYCEDIVLSPNIQYLISVGGKGGAVARCLAQKYALPLIQIQDPRHKRKEFPVIIAPLHDGLEGENIFSLPHAVHSITEEKLQQAREKWCKILKQDKAYLLSVLLGGSNGRYQFTLKEAYIIAQKIKGFLERNPSTSCWITASRRTSYDVIEYLKQQLDSLDVNFWDSRSEGDNPYLGLLACADIIAVTEETVSMISEAIATNALVALLPLRGKSRRITKFNAFLKQKGRLCDFDESLSFKYYEKLNDLPKALSFIEERVFFVKK